MKKNNFLKILKKILSNKKLWIFLICNIGYAIAFDIWSFSYHFEVELLGIAPLNLFKGILFSILFLVIMCKPRLLILLAFILSIVTSLLISPITTFTSNIIRIQQMKESDLPAYGKYIHWDGSGFIGYFTEYYLANVKENDEQSSEDIIEFFENVPQDCYSGKDRINEKYVIIYFGC